MVLAMLEALPDLRSVRITVTTRACRLPLRNLTSSGSTTTGQLVSNSLTPGPAEASKALTSEWRRHDRPKTAPRRDHTSLNLQGCAHTLDQSHRLFEFL